MNYTPFQLWQLEKYSNIIEVVDEESRLEEADRFQEWVNEINETQCPNS